MNWKAVAAILVVSVLIVVGWGFVRDSRVNADFPAIRAKSTEAEVTQLMGDPKQIKKSCEAYDTSVAPDCDHVFIYRSFFGSLRSKYWLVFFDKNELVTATSSELEP
jgi:hypothetical protein